MRVTCKKCDGMDITAKTVYLASPMSTYDTERYDRLLSLAKKAYPDAYVIAARNAFKSTRDWHKQWPVLLKEIDTLLLFPDEYMMIGKGVWQEYVDCFNADIPTLYLHDTGDTQILGLCDIEILQAGSHKRYARVIHPLSGQSHRDELSIAYNGERDVEPGRFYSIVHDNGITDHLYIVRSHLSERQGKKNRLAIVWSCRYEKTAKLFYG